MLISSIKEPHSHIQTCLTKYLVPEPSQDDTNLAITLSKLETVIASYRQFPPPFLVSFPGIFKAYKCPSDAGYAMLRDSTSCDRSSSRQQLWNTEGLGPSGTARDKPALGLGVRCLKGSSAQVIAQGAGPSQSNSNPCPLGLAPSRPQPKPKCSVRLSGWQLSHETLTAALIIVGITLFFSHFLVILRFPLFV